MSKATIILFLFYSVSIIFGSDLDSLKIKIGELNEEQLVGGHEACVAERTERSLDLVADERGTLVDQRLPGVPLVVDSPLQEVHLSVQRPFMGLGLTRGRDSGVERAAAL